MMLLRLHDKRFIFFALGSAILIIAGLGFLRAGMNKSAKQPGQAFYVDLKPNPALLYPALNQFPPAPRNPASAKVLIAPHHDLASRLIAEAMAKISSAKIKTVILIGPNHENYGAAEIITAPINWRFDLGEAKVDLKIVNALIDKKLAKSDLSRLSGEHSINTLIPFIKKYFPNALVAPLILNHNLNEDVADSLSDFLARQADENTLIIGSLDFSHYLPTIEANANDKITEQAIKDYDYAKIFFFSDAYVDSPVTLATTMKTAAKLGTRNLAIINHANSAELTNSENVLSSTSYFTILYSLKKN